MEDSNSLHSDPAGLEMSRKKPKDLAISLGFRLAALSRIIFGRERVLRFFLNRAWLSWRLAFEISGELYGDDFYVHARALSSEKLAILIPKNSSFVDIGCGDGYWCRIAAKFARKVVGIDYDKNTILNAQENNKFSNVTYEVGNVLVDIKEVEFDVALLSHVLEHIDDPNSFLEALLRVAKTLIVEVPDFENDPLNWVRLQQRTTFYTDGDHVREYTIETLTSQLLSSGWQILESFRRNGSILVVSKRK